MKTTKSHQKAAFNNLLRTLLQQYLAVRSERAFVPLFKAFLPVLYKMSLRYGHNLGGPEEAMGFLQLAFFEVVSKAEEIPAATLCWLYRRVTDRVQEPIRLGKKQAAHESSYSNTWAQSQENMAAVAMHDSPYAKQPYPNEIRDNPRKLLLRGYESKRLGPRTLELFVAHMHTGQFAAVSADMGLKLTTAYQRVTEGRKRLEEDRPRRPYSLSAEEAARLQAVLERLQSSSKFRAVSAPTAAPKRVEPRIPEPAPSPQEEPDEREDNFEEDIEEVLSSTSFEEEMQEVMALCPTLAAPEEEEEPQVELPPDEDQPDTLYDLPALSCTELRRENAPRELSSSERLESLEDTLYDF
jgi:hypothetical protein